MHSGNLREIDFESPLYNGGNTLAFMKFSGHLTTREKSQKVFSLLEATSEIDSPIYSQGTQTTMLQRTIAGGLTKGANKKSFVFVHQHGGYDVT